MTKKRPTLQIGLVPESQPEKVSAPLAASKPVATKPKPARTKTQHSSSRGGEGLPIASYKKPSVYLHPDVHHRLKEIALDERTNLQALFIEGVDAVLKKRGMGTVESLTPVPEKG